MLKNLAMIVILVAVLALAVKGSIYARQVWQEGHSSDVLLGSKQSLINERQKSASEIAADLARAKSQLADAASHLSDMRAGFSLSVFRDFVIEQHDSIQSALWTSDPFFNDPQSASPTLKLKTDSSTTAHIEGLRAMINNLISSWQTDTGSIRANDLVLINDYLGQLQDIVDNLTPQNSGLTQAEIDHYDQIVSDAQNAVDTATNAQDSNQVTPEDIQNQQNTVDQYQNTVNDIQQILNDVTTSNPDNTSGGSNSGTDNTGGNTGAGDTSGTNTGDNQTNEPPPSTASPPLAPTNNGKPTLIQGTNSF